MNRYRYLESWPKPPPADVRSIASWHFEEGGFVQVIASGEVTTRDALDMVATLSRMKLDELERQAPDAAQNAVRVAREAVGE